MTQCELCGVKEAKYDCEIEGTLMYVCEDCSAFGKIKGQGKKSVKIVVEEKNRPVLKEPEYVFLPGYGQRVKNARERMGLKQEELAKKLSLKTSLLHQIESEHFKPNIELAKKLEKQLHIKLIEEINDANELEDAVRDVKPIRPGGPITFGDIINIKRRKK